MQRLTPENAQQLMEAILGLKESFNNVRIEHEPAGTFFDHPRDYTTEELNAWLDGDFRTLNVGFDRTGAVYVAIYQVTADDSAILSTDFALQGNVIAFEARTGTMIKTTWFMFS